MRRAIRPTLVRNAGLVPALALVAGCAAGGAAGGAPAPAARGVESITPADVRRRIFLIADDSMGGRGTPSPGLEKAAAYVASEFQRLGLEPAGENGGYLQRYPLEVWRFVPESSGVTATGAAPAAWSIGKDVILQGGSAGGEVGGGVTLVAGDPGKGVAIDSQAVTGRVVVLGIGPHTNAAAGVILPLGPAAALAVVPDSMFSMLGGSAELQVRNPSEGGGMSFPPVLFLRRSTFEAWLAPIGVGSAALASEDSLSGRVLEGVSLRLRSAERLLERTSAPNVIGVVRGSDPVLRNEFVIFSAHMDHIGTASSGQGCSARGADSICNGADDDASGTVAVLELAEAFATAPARPKRSVAFIAVSGEERGLWGSAHFAAHPTIPLPSIVANLNSDMVGRSDTLKDSIAVIGRQHSDLGQTLDRVAAAHPELRLTPLDDPWPQEGLYARSDHFNFARKGVPVLFFTTGLHPDYHGADDTPDKIDSDKVARYAKLAYYLGVEVANAAERPRWDPDSHQKYVEGAKP